MRMVEGAPILETPQERHLSVGQWLVNALEKPFLKKRLDQIVELIEEFPSSLSRNNGELRFKRDNQGALVFLRREDEKAGVVTHSSIDLVKDESGQIIIIEKSTKLANRHSEGDYRFSEPPIIYDFRADAPQDRTLSLGEVVADLRYIKERIAQ